MEMCENVKKCHVWTCIENVWKCMEMHGNEWKCMQMSENVRKCMEMHGNV